MKSACMFYKVKAINSGLALCHQQSLSRSLLPGGCVWASWELLRRPAVWARAPPQPLSPGTHPRLGLSFPVADARG